MFTWLMWLEVMLYVLAPLLTYYYVKLVLELGKFKRTYDLMEGANTWGRVDELRCINRQLERIGKRFILVLAIALVVMAIYAYLRVRSYS